MTHKDFVITFTLGKNEAISFVTVGGRTSAVVLAVQKLPGKDVKQTTVMDAKRLERGKSASSNFEKQVRLETDSELFNSPLNEELAESETTSGVGGMSYTYSDACDFVAMRVVFVQSRHHRETLSPRN